MLSQAQVGPLATTSSLPVGTQANLRTGNMGDLIDTKLQPDYYESCYRRANFGAANQTGRVTTVGPALTYNGICLSNPIGSTVNLVPTFVGYSFPVAPAAAVVVGIMIGYNSSTNVTHSTPITPRSNFFGVGASPVGLVDEVATLPTAPIVAKILGTVYTAAITTSPTAGPALTDLKGSIILPPGAYMAIFTSTVANTAGFLGSIDWVEVPV